jgi:circadian clock protein KaiB
MDGSNSSSGKFDEDRFAQVLERKSKEKYILRLYVVNMSSKSIQAIRNIKRICDENLEDRYQLDVVDILQQPALARESQIIATPTLIKESPLPLRRLVGNMSNTRQVLFGLGLLSCNELNATSENAEKCG